jgi:hypothetical protein
MTVQITDLSYALREYWLAPPAQEALDKAGPLALDMQKGAHTSFETAGMYWSGTGTGLLALRTRGSGNVGSDVANAITDSFSDSGVRFQPKAARYHAPYVIDGDELELLMGQSNAADPQGLTELMQRLNMIQQNWWKSFSVYSYRDGRGACASLAAGSAVGTTITLANRDMVIAFEIGDILVGYDPAVYNAAALGVLSAARTGTVTVTQRDEELGTLTLSAAWSTLDGGSGAAGDFIGHRDYREQNTSQFSGLYGIATWLSFNSADRTATALGVVRAADPGRIAGRFKSLPAGTPVSEVIKQMMTIAGRFSIRLNRVYAPSKAWNDVQANFQGQTRTSYDATTMRFGVEGAEFVGPNCRGPILCDPYLWDLKSGADIYVGLIDRNVGLVTTPAGVGWDQVGYAQKGGAPIIAAATTNNKKADYRAVGNVVVKNPNDAIVIRVG